MENEVKLFLEDGSEFKGKSFGAEITGGGRSGEVVFNTGMVGYVEALTDPSYKGQILVMTYPLVGNYGVPVFERDKYGLLKNFESDRIHARGLVVADYCAKYSHWKAVKSLGDWLKDEGVPAVYGVDTRKLTMLLREKGSMLGGLFCDRSEIKEPDWVNIVKRIGVKEPFVYKIDKGVRDGRGIRIVVLDCGVKNNILRSLLCRGVEVVRVPWDYNIFNGDYDFDGILISNGPANPKLYKTAIKNIKNGMEREIPIFGVCLGNQILALASGGDTYKLRYGHRSQNQPSILVGTENCFITSQNHGYSVDVMSLPAEWRESWVNANDGSNEGIMHVKKPFFSVQFHPEARPGPVDTSFLFDSFLEKARLFKKENEGGSYGS